MSADRCEFGPPSRPVISRASPAMTHEGDLLLRCDDVLRQLLNYDPLTAGSMRAISIAPWWAGSCRRRSPCRRCRTRVIAMP